MLEDTHYFLSFNSADRKWAEWISFVLEEHGAKVSNHYWEIGAGENIIKWMRENLDKCDSVVSLFSQNYLDAAFSQAEQDYGIYSSIEGFGGAVIPIVVGGCKLPSLVRPLKRFTIYDVPEDFAEEALLSFLAKPSKPVDRPKYPGSTHG